jgi:hypothetical protein
MKISRAAFASAPFLLVAVERWFALNATASSYLLATNSGAVQRLEILGSPSSPRMLSAASSLSSSPHLGPRADAPR